MHSLQKRVRFDFDEYQQATDLHSRDAYLEMIIFCVCICAGVLDSEELSIVNKTFQKVLENPKPSSNRQFAQASKLLKPVMIPKANLSSQRITSCVSGQQNTAMATTHSSRSSVNSLIGTGLKRPEQCLSNSNGKP